MTGSADSGIPSLANLKLRSHILAAVRQFFAARDFIEVETPVRIAAPANELHIDAPPAGSGFWLRASPELHMKRLLAAGCERIFQIGPCFRAGELGRLHNPEFTMLEWYRAQADATAILDDAKLLLPQVARVTLGSATIQVGSTAIALAQPWIEMTISEAFRKWAGWDPVSAYDADRFDLDMVNLVEPALPRERPVVLSAYPAAAAALARLAPTNPAVAERWELYLGGVEIANAYGELTDPVAQRERFVACAAARRAAGREAYPLDEDFLAALTAGLPPTGGIALGLDRLVMLLCGVTTITQARPFCQSR